MDAYGCIVSHILPVVAGWRSRIVTPTNGYFVVTTSTLPPTYNMNLLLRLFWLVPLDRAKDHLVLIQLVQLRYIVNKIMPLARMGMSWIFPGEELRIDVINVARQHGERQAAI